MADVDAIDEVESLARELALYDERDEPTVPEIHMHLPQPSIHDEDPPTRKLKSAAVALGIGLGTALLTGLAAFAKSCGHR